MKRKEEGVVSFVLCGKRKDRCFPRFLVVEGEKSCPPPPPHFVAVGAWEELGLSAVWREIAMLGAFSLGQ